VYPDPLRGLLSPITSLSPHEPDHIHLALLTYAHLVLAQHMLIVQVIRERRVLLEAYLRSILTTKDPRWRQAYTFSDFLSVPTPRAGSSSSTHHSSSSVSGVPAPPDHWTPMTWLAEQGALSSLVRSIRSALLKRDALAGMSDASGSRSASVEAKRLLKELSARLDGLDTGLGRTGTGLGEGEKRRREEMVENLRAERDNLQRMADAGVRTSAASAAFSSRGNDTGGAGVGAGAGVGSGSSVRGTGTMPGGTGSLWGPPPPSSGGRVFGKQQPPQETSETRPLDDRGLLQLQQNKMTNQDDQLGELSKVLVRQRKMGEEIAQEIGEQNELLDGLDHEVDRTGKKLGRAKRELNRLG
jgi:regulator of vacuolar morphogenesis